MSSHLTLFTSRIYDLGERIGILDTFGRSWPMKASLLRVRPVSGREELSTANLDSLEGKARGVNVDGMIHWFASSV